MSPAPTFPRALLETMLAVDGRVPLLARHLARMEHSAAALGLSWPGAAAARDAVAAALAGTGGRARVRLVLGREGLTATAVPEPEPRWTGAAAVSLRGTWDPGLSRATHKALPRDPWDRSQAVARERGAEHALLLDDRGRLGEAAVGNVFAAVAGTLVTAPARGLLAGVARAVLLERLPVRVDVLEEAEWRAADELFVTNAVRGVVPLTRVDGRIVGAGRPGPVATRALAALQGALKSP